MGFERLVRRTLARAIARMAPKGELIAADKKLRLIDAATGEVGREVSQSDAGNASLRGVAFHPNGDLGCK